MRGEAREKGEDGPSLRNDDVVKGRVAFAKARKADFQDHAVAGLLASLQGGTWVGGCGGFRIGWDGSGSRSGSGNGI